MTVVEIVHIFCIFNLSAVVGIGNLGE
jgi:hypothetical protein